MKPSIKIPVYNGSLECEFRKYSIFDGKFKEFRAEGGVVKTDREKAEMAQKHRFKKNREFKERITATEENDEGDIRSFKFHSLEKKFDKDGDKPRFARRGKDNDGDDRREGKRFERKGDGKSFGKGDRKYGDKDDRKFGGKGDRKFGGKFDKGDRRGSRDDKRFDRKGGSKFGKKNFSKDFNYDE